MTLVDTTVRCLSDAQFVEVALQWDVGLIIFCVMILAAFASREEHHA